MYSRFEPWDMHPASSSPGDTGQQHKLVGHALYLFSRIVFSPGKYVPGPSIKRSHLSKVCTSRCQGARAPLHQVCSWGAVSPVESSSLLHKTRPCSWASVPHTLLPCLRDFPKLPNPVWLLLAPPDQPGSVARVAGQLAPCLAWTLCRAFLFYLS